MSVWISRYVLRPLRSLNARAGARPRTGALLRIGDGFADLHPWPELGDADLDAHLASIAARTPTRLARRSLACAHIDAKARAGRKWLFEGETIPRSHYLLLEGDRAGVESIAEAGFRAIKTKAGLDPVRDAARLNALAPAIGLRIDLNASFGTRELDAFLGALEPTVRERIEFIEDPLPADAGWESVREQWGIPLAADREKPDASFWDVAVVKPASEEPAVAASAVAQGKTVVFTSAMDHPLGQLWAAWNAAVFARMHPGRVLDCGLLTHDIYENDEFTERLGAADAVLVPPPGTGLGFDDLLEALPWEKLA